MSTALTLVDEQPTFTNKQLELIKTTIAPGVDDDQLALFVEVAKRTGLDPFSRQIYAILRNTKEGERWVKKMTIQTGIDGYRAIAARTGVLAGIDDATYDTEDADHPNKASVTVWRMIGEQRCPFTATARWSEYKPEKDGMWVRMPFLMLGKCAEALALRKAFPNEISGVYTAEEMAQANETPAITVVNAAGATVDTRTGEHVKPAANSDPWGEVRELSAQLCLSDEERKELFSRHKKNRDKILAELRERYANETDQDGVTFETEDNSNGHSLEGLEPARAGHN